MTKTHLKLGEAVKERRLVGRVRRFSLLQDTI